MVLCTPNSKQGCWRSGRVVEGAPLLREYGAKSLIEGSNPSFSGNLETELKRSVLRRVWMKNC